MRNMDTGETLDTVLGRVQSANAYIGAAPIVQALAQDATVVITGRSTDTALTYAPMMHAFGWAADDYDRLASGVVAGHINECGAQVVFVGLGCPKQEFWMQAHASQLDAVLIGGECALDEADFTPCDSPAEYVDLESQLRNLEATVETVERVADGVVSLVLRRVDGSDFPAWEPGAHIDVLLEDGLVRQYSLCSSPEELDHVRIGVLHVPDSRGGSKAGAGASGAARSATVAGGAGRGGRVMLSGSSSTASFSTAPLSAVLLASLRPSHAARPSAETATRVRAIFFTDVSFGQLRGWLAPFRLRAERAISPSPGVRANRPCKRAETASPEFLYLSG